MSQAPPSPATRCCGADRSSLFCPECGRQLAAGPLVDLLAHCRVILRRQQRLLDQQTRVNADRPTKRGEANRDQYARAVAAWEERCAALVRVIERDREPTAAVGAAAE